jgi:prepilin-type N-terminal cleavage/methylation domain-containing protein
MALQRNKHGFTLVELMIVVAIIGVLAVVAGTAYRRYMDSGRTAEAMSMLGEIRAKEEAYRAEFSTYTGWSAGSETAANSLPAVDNTTCTTGSTKEPCPKAIPVTNVYWSGLGINAGRNSLYCGYILNADIAGKTVTGTIGGNLLGTAPQTLPWWYAIAICDNDGTPGDGNNATFATAFNTTVVSAQNEHK